MNKPVHPAPAKNHIPSATERLIATQLFTVGLTLVVAGMISLEWSVSLFLVMMIFVIAIVMFIRAARVLRMDPNITVALIALGLAFA